MLSITITPSMLTFKEINNEMYEVIKKKYHKGIFYNGNNEAVVRDTPENLYKLLLALSYVYDIEIS